MSFSKGNFTINEIEFIEAATVRVLVAVSKGELDLNLLAREELCQRGFDRNGVWIGLKRAREEFCGDEVNRNGLTKMANES